MGWNRAGWNRLAAELTPQELEARRKYKREWNLKRRASMTGEELAHIRDIDRRSRKKHLSSRRAAARKYYAEHRDRLRVKMRARYYALPERVRKIRSDKAQSARKARGRAKEIQNRRLIRMFDAAVRLAAAGPAT